MIDTPFGRVNQGILNALKDDFSAIEILKMVEEFDQRVQAFQEDGGLRAQLLTLHGMLHTVMDGAQVTVSSEQTLPDLASDALDEVQECLDMFGRWTAMLSLVRELGTAEPFDSEEL
ncbi:hypothetical protein [uncultured Variovorax sp.]|uniref:hypothetical protein n=1 Tax=uncultured Variovorax sp. TaxID=114708 RepID=UPI0026222C4F|nr:hypothetical protein [uncultured Variovorax sp.]